MYNKHEHFRQVKHVYILTRICSEYVVSKSVFALIIIVWAYYQLGRLPAKYALFFDKSKSYIPKYKNLYSYIYVYLLKSVFALIIIFLGTTFQLCIKLPMNSDDFLVSIFCSLIK